MTGRSSAWLERLLWEQEVARSNRVAPTFKPFLKQGLRKDIVVYCPPDRCGPLSSLLCCNFLCKITPLRLPESLLSPSDPKPWGISHILHLNHS